MRTTFLMLGTLLLCSLCAPNLAQAQIISEFEPNPAGGDPTESTIELFGTANAAFDLNLISVENDGFNGIVDRAENVSGTFDATGIAVVQISDLENPSFSLFLTELFSGAVGDDLDVNGDGTLDVSGFGEIFDVVGVSDEVADDSVLYSSAFSFGTSLLFNGAGEPEGAFREGNSGDFFQHVGGSLFDANGAAFDETEFDKDPFITTFGDLNPTFLAVPEPSSFVLLAFAGVMGISRRRKR